MTFCRIRTLGILLSCLTAISISTQMIVEANETKPLSKTYKTIGTTQLNLILYGVQDPVTGPPKPAIVFFFGGGWRSGSPRQFEHHARYLASRGMIGITADYRVSSRHRSKALQSVQDAKSAIRWVRENASELGVDPDRIVASGGSAGGHLAACTAVIPGMGELNEDLTIGSQPNALVLFNPALLLAAAPGYPQWDASREESLRLRMGTAPKNLSPWHFVQSATPPTLIFHGQADTTVPFWTAQAFQQAQLNHGGRSRLVAFPGAKHGFFNFGRSNNAAFRKTLAETDRFLQSLGYLEGPQRVDDYLARVAPSK